MFIAGVSGCPASPFTVIVGQDARRVLVLTSAPKRNSPLGATSGHAMDPQEFEHIRARRFDYGSFKISLNYERRVLA